MRYQHFLRTLALFYRKKEKKEIKTKFGLESKFLVKRLFNSLNDRGSWIGSIFTNTHRSLKLQALQWDNLCIPASTDATSQRLSLSYAEASLCRIETGEREKRKSRGERWEGIFLFPSSTARSEVFNYCFFLSKYPTEASSEERVAKVTFRWRSKELFKYDSICYLRFETSFSCQVLLCNT